MIELDAVTAGYGSRTALDDVTLRVDPGEFVLVAGRSGCGKTTLARVLTGQIPRAVPASLRGRVRVGEVDPTRTPLPSLATRVGLVFQNPATQLFCLSVEEEVAFGPRNLGLAETEVAERVRHALEATGLEAFRARVPADLSGGEQQRVAIAAALALAPPVLVLDEPLANLDRTGARHVLEVLARLAREHGTTILLIEHRLRDVVPCASRIVLMDRGRIVDDGPAARLGGESGRLAELGLAPPPRPAPAVRRSVGTASKARPLLELRDVRAGYGDRVVLDGVDLSLSPGDFVALVGDNGAGKSTLALVAAGLLRPRGGIVSTGDGRKARAGLDVGMLCQNPLEQILTERVEDEVALGPRNWATFEAGAHEAALRAADLEALRDRAPLSLSAGQQQRTVLAATLATRPRLVILDEPTLGQDWAHMARFMDFVNGLNAQGSAVLLITHDPVLASRYARRIVVLRDGRIVADGREGAEEVEG